MSLRHWTAMERRWLTEVIDVMLPGDPSVGLPRSMSALGGAAFVDALVARAPALPRLGLRAATWVLMWAPVWRWGRMRRLAALAQAEQERLLDALHHSRIYAVRELPLLVKTFGVMCWAGTGSVQRAIGVPLDPNDRLDWEAP